MLIQAKFQSLKKIWQDVNLKIHFENLLQFKVLILNEYHFYINPNNNLNHYEHYLFMWTRIWAKTCYTVTDIEIKDVVSSPKKIYRME